MEGETRVGGTSYEAIVATLEKLTEAIDTLNRIDDQRGEQIASLEVAQAEIRRELLHLNIKYDALRAASSGMFDKLAARLDRLNLRR